MKSARLWTIWFLALTVVTASIFCCCVDKISVKVSLPSCHLHKAQKMDSQPCECSKKLSVISAEFVHVDIAIKEVPQNTSFLDVARNIFSLAQSFLPQWSHDPPGLASIIPLYIKNPSLRI